MVRNSLPKNDHKSLIRAHVRRVVAYVRQHPKKVGCIGGGVAVAMLLIAQAVWLSYYLPPFLTIDGRAVGGMKPLQVAEQLDEAYKQHKVTLAAEATGHQLTQIALHDIGIEVKNDNRSQQARAPQWSRILPGALLWSHKVVSLPAPVYYRNNATLTAYIDRTFTTQCYIAPQNATLAVKGDALEVVSAKPGGRCQYGQLQAALQAVEPNIRHDHAISLPVQAIEPKVKDDKAHDLKQKIEMVLQKSVGLQYQDKKVELAGNTLRSWLRFQAPDDVIITEVDAAASEPFLKEKAVPLVAKEAGVTRVTTRDFVEVSRSNGALGVGLQYEKTRQQLARYATGEAKGVVLQTQPVQPKVEYTRSYSNSDEGLSALIAQYAEERKGEFGVALIELSGSRRRAMHNAEAQFTSASTYKMLLAFSVLKRVESGQLSWNDAVVGGRNLAKCFDDMIVLSDNPCPMELVKRIGPSAVHKDMKELGLQFTSFVDANSFKMTAGDLAQFAAMLEARQLPISRDHQDKLLDAMKRNVHRKGIPAGSKGKVADKVGFIEDYLHDVGVVYDAPGGTYVLAVLTKGSSWADIAELTRRIEALRAG